MLPQISQIHAEVPHSKHLGIKVISARLGRSKKELMNEAIDYLLHKYKECLSIS